MPVAKKSARAAVNQSFVFVTGSDESGVKKAASALADELKPGDDPFALEVIDGAVGTADEAANAIHLTMSALLTLPFFGGKLVWLKNVSFLDESRTALSETVQKAWEELTGLLGKDLPDGITFLLSAPSPSKRRSAYLQLSKLGRLTLCDKPDLGFGAGEAELASWVADRAQACGLRLSASSAELLASRVGLDPGQLDSELEKIALVSGDSGQIDPVLLRQLVPQTREGVIFDLSNSIYARDLQEAMSCLSQLLRQRESAIGVLLAAIVPCMRNLLLIKDLMVRYRLTPPDRPQFFTSQIKRLPEEELEQLPKKKDGTVSAYSLGIAASHAKNYTLAELEKGLALCREANLALVSGNAGEQTVLSRLLAAFMGRP